MEFWIVCWVKGNNAPEMDVFSDHETAMKCMEYVSANFASVIIRKVTLVKQEAPEEAAEEEKVIPLPVEEQEAPADE